MRRWRIVLHALDRTGPPMLGLHLRRWLERTRPGDAVDVVSLRGGPLLEEFLRSSDVVVLLDPEEAWGGHQSPRSSDLIRRAEHLPPADATLVVSVSAADAARVMVQSGGPVLMWVVEQEEDFPSDLPELVDCWIAGSVGIRQNVLKRLGTDPGVIVCPEFVDVPARPTRDVVHRYRRAMGAGPDSLLVVGVGIATLRKGIDLFVETALRWERTTESAARFVWIGGERDPLFQPLTSVVREGSASVALMESVADVVPWLSAADVLLHPARQDAFPLVCLHAATVGTPVVAFDGAGGVGEMFGASFVGSPYPDLAGLIDHLEQLRDSTVRASIADAQRSYVMQRFTSDVVASSVFDQLRVAAGGT